MRRFIAPAAAGCALLALAACSADSGDFKEEGEKYIESDDVAEQAGASFSNAVCQQPEDTETGTMYTCTADGDDGGAYTFEIEITGDNELTVTGLIPAGAAQAPAGTTPAGSAPAPTDPAAPATTAA